MRGRFIAIEEEGADRKRCGNCQPSNCREKGLPQVTKMRASPNRSHALGLSGCYYNRNGRDRKTKKSSKDRSEGCVEGAPTIVHQRVYRWSSVEPEQPETE